MSLLRTVAMVHFRAQVPAREGNAVARAIAREGLLHLVDIAHGRTTSESAPAGAEELYAAYRDLRTRVRTAAQKLDITLQEPEGSLLDQRATDLAADRERFAATLDPIAKQIDARAQTLAAASERAAVLREQIDLSRRLRNAGVDVRRAAAVQFGTVRFALADERSIETLALLLAPSPFAVIPLEPGEPALIAIVVANFAKARLDEALRVALVQPVAIPSLPVDRLCAHLNQCEVAADAARAEIQKQRKELGPLLIDMAKQIEVGTLLLQAQTHFAAAGRFLVISGWLPAEATQRMKARIHAAAGESAVIDVEPAESVPGVLEGSLRVPILHRNPLVLRPFQRLVDIYGTASYNEVQPTAFFAISFLLMFGMMFGDAGHGAVLFLAGWSLFRFLPQYLDYGVLLMEAGAASALFGVLYGSVFGIHSLLPTLWLEPMHDLSHFITIAVLLGAAIVTGGLALNIINCWRSGNIRDALYGPRGIFGALMYWVVLVLVARAFVGDTVRLPQWLIVVLAGAALLVMAFGRTVAARFERHRPRPAVHAGPRVLTLLESAIELVDTLFSYFANTISFVRVAAFAAVHAGVFLAIFAVADTLASMRGGTVLAIAAHVAGNAVMILLEGLTVSVQVLRLEYYEFFGKFFRGGGEPYVPLMLRQNDSFHDQMRRKHA